MNIVRSLSRKSVSPLHATGVIAGIAAGAWLGTAEAPTQLVTTGISPFIVSAAMVMGVFVARWTIPTLLKGTSYIITDLRLMLHLLVWGILAGAFEAVANTLTIFAIKDVGLAIAFPIWNSNSLIGILWGWLLFNELKGAGKRQWTKVAGGAVAIVIATVILGYASTQSSGVSTQTAFMGILAALGASVLWGTSYIPYRKAYLSGMNPLSFLTVFTVGELGTVLLLSYMFLGGVGPLVHELILAKSSLFWLFFGGFCWVVGDIFQQFAVKYIGIGRGIPLANTNQIWGVAWAALVFCDLRGANILTIILILGGCLLMIFGAGCIASTEASGEEHNSWNKAVEKECVRYNLNKERVMVAVSGGDPLGLEKKGHAWWDILIVIIAVGIFVFFAMLANKPALMMNYVWLGIIAFLSILVAVIGGLMLHKHTGFS